MLIICAVFHFKKTGGKKSVGYISMEEKQEGTFLRESRSHTRCNLLDFTICFNSKSTLACCENIRSIQLAETLFFPVLWLKNFSASEGDTLCVLGYVLPCHIMGGFAEFYH